MGASVGRQDEPICGAAILYDFGNGRPAPVPDKMPRIMVPIFKNTWKLD